MSEFHIKIRGFEIKDSEIIQAIHAEEIVPHSDRAMAEGLVKLFARGVGDQRNLRPIAEPRQPASEIILSRRGFLSGSRKRGKQKEEK